MPRSTMAALLTRVRTLINDPTPAAPGVPVFADAVIQDVLDRNRDDVRLLPLDYRVTIGAGSAATYNDYYAVWGDWEDDVQLQGPNYATLTPDTSENLVGHWRFTVSQIPPVWLTGKTYDVYRAAADLLEMRAAQLALAFDFQVDGQRFQRSQQAPALLTLARQYRQQQRARDGRLTRDDIRQRQQFPRLGRLIPRVYE